MTATNFCPTAPFNDAVEAAFLIHLPRIEAHAKYALRRVACADTRADLVAETLALAWKHFAALARRGKSPETFVATLALRCTQAVRAGRRLTGSERDRDVLSPVARDRHGVRVEHFSELVPVTAAVAEALEPDTRTSVPDQVAFRVDFPAWRARFRDRDRAVLDALARGDRACEVAVRFGISFGRVSQLRSSFEESWAAFHGDVKEPEQR